MVFQNTEDMRSKLIESALFRELLIKHGSGNVDVAIGDAKISLPDGQGNIKEVYVPYITTVNEKHFAPIRLRS